MDFRWRPKTEVYDAEILGPCGGLELVLSRQTVELIYRIHVCTVKLSVTQKAGYIPNASGQAVTQHWVQQRRMITFKCVPSHMGIQGNEKADIHRSQKIRRYPLNRRISGDTNIVLCPKSYLPEARQSMAVEMGNQR